ncbi:MAG: thiamine-phosphate kinase [Burkholderiales bacterium]
MPLGEFDLIARYFARPACPPGPALASRVAQGNGDDCALLQVAPGMQLAISSDMLVEGRHFLPTVAPERLGHKALAVNLSDLAACGARPLAYTLALAMPRVDEAFLAGFSRGLHALADAHGISLIGGDTTAGPLNLCITVFGEVPAGQALLRSGACPGHDLWVSHARSGGLGDARLALEAFRGRVNLPGDDFERVRRAMEQPQPRVALGLALRGVACSAIDVSDGLLGDLAHILRRSGAAPSSPLGATLQAEALPLSPVLARQSVALQLECRLSGGDDYELLFTATPADAPRVLAAATASATPVRRIGRIEAEPGVRVIGPAGEPIEAPWLAFDHFRS